MHTVGPLRRTLHFGGSVGVAHEHAIEHERVEVHVQVRRAAEPLRA
jgi:hypothetical protein